MHKCYMCGKQKLSKYFYKDSSRSKGVSSSCKICTSIRLVRAMPSDPEKVRELRKKYYKQNKHRLRKYNRDYSKNNLHKFRAKWAVGQAILKGALKRSPCKKCGSVTNVDAHHEDYSKPLDIVWLCRKHHQKLHHDRLKRLKNKQRV